MKKSVLISAVILLAIVFILSLGLYIYLSRRSAQEPAPTETPTAAITPEVPTAEEPTQASEQVVETPPVEETMEPTPEVQQEPDHSQRAGEILSEMTLTQKICQMMIIDVSSYNGNYPVGGVVFFQADIQSREQVTQDISNIQQSSLLGLFVCVDEEGGTVTRTGNIPDIPRIGPMFDYRDQGEDVAYDNAKTIAGYLTELGFNFDLAPVADVYSNPANTVIGSRAYSDDFEQAAVLVASAVRGFNDGGVACCLKHFPGHGDTAEDTHAGTAIADKSLSELTQQEFLPFISGIEAGADAVMTGHMTLTSIDPEHPSSLSYTVVTGLLRERLGYDGVVMTDALTMGALSNQYTADEIVVMAVQAGNDILLGPADVAGTISAIENAISTGELTEERINESVLRILELKLERGIIN